MRSAARRAVKNILYTMISTLDYNQAFDRDSIDLMFNISVGPADRSVTHWWIPVLVVFDVLVAAGLGVWSFFLIRPRMKNEEPQTASE